MTTRKKITAGFIIIFIIGLILGICGLVSSNMLTTLSEQQYQLQLTGSSISTVLNAHYTWRQSLTEAVLNGSKFEGSLESTTCALGTWRSGGEAKSVTDGEVLNLLQELDEPHAYIHNQARTVVEMINAGNSEGAKRELVDNILPRTADVITALTKMESRYAALIGNKGTEILNMGRRINTIIIILIVISAIVSLALGILITRSIMRPIHEMAEVAKTISTGDLDVHINYSVKDEIGRLADAFRVLLSDIRKQVNAAESLANGDLTVSIEQRSDKDVMNLALKNMVDNLNSMFSDIQVASAQVSSGASQVSQGAQELASGSSQQSASIEEFSATLTDMQDKTNHSAEQSTKAQEANGKTAQMLEGSIHSMGEMLRAMKGIDESAQNITRVIKVIDDIAFQTNILALNAAVEAARAGQHGKGFAVVADEVRSLAAKSAEAAKETSELIEGSSQRVKEGNEIVAKTNADLETAVENARESTGLIEQVAAESVEQAKSIAEISQGIEQISSVVQSNSATAQQSAAAAEEMSAQSVVLNEIVAKFKLKDSGHQAFGSTGQPATREQRESTSFAMSGSKY